MARDLWKVPQVQETIKETARLIWTTPGLTINLLPSALALLGLAALALFFFDYFPYIGGFPSINLGGCDCHRSRTRYVTGYGYEAPSDEYGTSASGYDTTADGYEETGFRRRRAVEAIPEARMIYDMIKASDLGVQPDFRHLHHLQHGLESAQGQATSLLA